MSIGEGYLLGKTMTAAERPKQMKRKGVDARPSRAREKGRSQTGLPEGSIQSR